MTSISIAGIVLQSNNTSNSTKKQNQNFISNDTQPSILQAGEVTEYPVFIDETEAVTESYMIVEDQVVDDDDDDDDSESSTISSILQPTTPMQSPKSSPEQEEVLRELKKLWDLSEGMGDSGNDALKNSLSSIVHLAYARVYIEPDETLMKLKYLLQQLHERILRGTNLNNNESTSTTENVLSLRSSSTTNIVGLSSATTTATTGTGATNYINNDPTEIGKTRRKRSFYDGFDDVEAIFFANINSEENSVIPDVDHKHNIQKLLQASSSQNKHVLVNKNITTYENIPPVNVKIKSNNTLKLSDSLDRTLLSTAGTISSSTMSTRLSTWSSSTTPSTAVQKVVHINDRQKPMPSFYLTPERIKELKSRVTSTPSTLTTSTTSTLSPISIAIDDDELENQVNLLQQQHEQVDNYDIQISSAETLVPLLTTTVSPSSSSTSFHKKPTSPTTTELSYKPEDIALALFQLLRPSAFDEDESEDEGVTSHQPHPSPSNILYQVGSLSSVLNFTIKANNVSTTTTTTTTTAAPVKMEKAPTTTTSKTTTLPFSSSSTTMMPSTTKFDTTLSILKLKDKYVKNNFNVTAPLFVPAPTILSDLGLLNATSTSKSILLPQQSTSTERQKPAQNNDAYDYTDVVDQTSSSSSSDPSMTTTIVQGTHEGLQQMVTAITGLSVGAKMVLLFSVCISILSIGFGIFAVQPPLASIGVLGIVIPVGLLLLFETTASAGKRKLTTRQREQLIIEKLQSEEFSRIVNMIFDGITKYTEG